MQRPEKVAANPRIHDGTAPIALSNGSMSLDRYGVKSLAVPIGHMDVHNTWMLVCADHFVHTLV